VAGEAFTVGATVALRQGLPAFLALHGAVLALLLWASAVDARERIIPDGAGLGVLAAAAASAALGGDPALFPGPPWLLAGGVLAFLLLSVLALLSGGGVGGGDVKMAAALGFFLGVPDVFWLLLTACLAGLAWAVLRGEKRVPFAPFMAFGFLVADALRLFLAF